MARSRTWCDQKGNFVILGCLVWILQVFYTSMPFLDHDNYNHLSILAWSVATTNSSSSSSTASTTSGSISSISSNILKDGFNQGNTGPNDHEGKSNDNHHHDQQQNQNQQQQQHHHHQDQQQENHKTGNSVVNTQGRRHSLKNQHSQEQDMIGWENKMRHYARVHLNYTDPEYMRKRIENFHTWFQGNETKKLFPNADENGTILDFAIVGFPKCGTTTLEANLGYLAPMPLEDICTPVHQTVWYAYQNWPTKYATEEGGTEKLWRGTKCPAFIQGEWLLDWSKYLPRTKLIVGVRHPILWFQSFWNMQVANHLTTFAGNDPYKLMQPCPNSNGRGCRNGCPSRQLLCMHRGRFHLALASLGKTALSQEERSILAFNDPDGGEHVRNHGIRNPIFVYEQHMLGEDYMWRDLASYLGVDYIRHDKRVNSHGKNRALEINFCDDEYDAFRAGMMPIAYEVALWLQLYLVPLAKNESRTDVIVSNPDVFYSLVEKYKEDPCGKLQRMANGTFVKKLLQ